MPFTNVKEKIMCDECGHINEVLTLESYNSARIVQGTVSGTKNVRHHIPVRVISTGKCEKCGKSIRKAIREEFPGCKIL